MKRFVSMARQAAAFITSIIDTRNQFAKAVSVVGAAGTALIGDVIDLGTNGRDIGNGQPEYLIITIDTEVITAGAAGTIKFALASDAQAAIATDGSATVHVETPALVTGAANANSNLLNAGAMTICVGLPVGTYERYLGILATIGTTAVTAGKINAYLSNVPRGWKAYPDAL